MLNVRIINSKKKHFCTICKNLMVEGQKCYIDYKADLFGLKIDKVTHIECFRHENSEVENG